MNKTLANTVGDRINKFDSLEIQTVETFNELFPECPIKMDLSFGVEIKEVRENNTRFLVIDQKDGTETYLKHKMYSDILYTLDKQDYFLDERDTELTEINGTPV